MLKRVNNPSERYLIKKSLFKCQDCCCSCKEHQQAQWHPRTDFENHWSSQMKKR
uniref:Uncharacterized protein n=1 Tax=Anguilla anguilla TaxID=7936 RepID=A0A0E9SS30_ANGAN